MLSLFWRKMLNYGCLFCWIAAIGWTIVGIRGQSGALQEPQRAEATIVRVRNTVFMVVLGGFVAASPVVLAYDALRSLRRKEAVAYDWQPGRGAGDMLGRTEVYAVEDKRDAEAVVLAKLRLAWSVPPLVLGLIAIVLALVRAL